MFYLSTCFRILRSTILDKFQSCNYKGGKIACLLRTLAYRLEEEMSHQIVRLHIDAGLKPEPKTLLKCAVPFAVKIAQTGSQIKGKYMMPDAPFSRCRNPVNVIGLY